jgi:hypothetical protein
MRCAVQVERFVAQSFLKQGFSPEVIAALPPAFLVDDLLATVTAPFVLAKGDSLEPLNVQWLAPCIDFHV